MMATCNFPKLAYEVRIRALSSLSKSISALLHIASGKPILHPESYID